MQVIDLGVPANPVRVGGGDNGGFGENVAVVGNHVYVTGGSRGMLILKTLFESPQPPRISFQPRSRTNEIGTTALLSVNALGSVPLYYQWRKDGRNLANDGRFSGTAAATLRITNVQPGDASTYSVVVSNAQGSVASESAILTVPAALQLLVDKEHLWAANEVLHLSVIGPAGIEAILEASTNLVDWTPVQTNSLPAGGLEFALPLDARQCQFYRARRNQ